MSRVIWRGLLRLVLGLSIVAMLTVLPCVYYRWTYSHAKRLREVEPGRLYRSGQLTAAGFAEAIEKYHIRTVVNLQDEFADPDVREGYFQGGTEKESALCARLGVRYVFMPPALNPPPTGPENRLETIDRFLKLMDDPSNLPVLLHCRAGLHRTGVLVAVYRMEYDGWSRAEAAHELQDNGFGNFACSSANEYIVQYLLNYQPRTAGAVR